MGAFARKRYARGRRRDRRNLFSAFPISRRAATLRPRCCRAASSRCSRSAAGCWPTPKLMMLDEPSLGLSPRLTNEVFALIGELNRSRGLAILLVEQNTHGRWSSPIAPMCWSLDARSWKGRRPHCATIHPCAMPIWGAPSRAQSRCRINVFEPRRGVSAMRSKLLGLLARDGFVGRGQARAVHAQEILLGNLAAGAGPFATLAKTNEIAAQMAVDEINAAGGVAGKKLKIVSFDTAGKPEQAVVGVRKLAEDDKVMAIIGPFSSGECRVAFPAAERAGVVTMSMASSAPKLAEPFTYGLRNTSDEGYMFRHVMKTLKDKKYSTATGAVAPTPPTTSSPRRWARSCCRTS